MFAEYVVNNFRNLFMEEKFNIVYKNNQVRLIETQKQGEADLLCTMEDDSIVIHQPDKNVLLYLKKGIPKKCPDEFIFSDNGGLVIKIVELKRTVNESKFKEIIFQVQMGVYFARAIAAYSGITNDSVDKKFMAYVGYRNDDLSCDEDMIDGILEEKGIIGLREANSSQNIKEYSREQCMWVNNLITVKVDGENMTIPLGKIQLDQFGNGTANI